jgi:hypothetical protein
MRRDPAIARDAARVASVERRREATQRALAEIYSGASFAEADALIDQLGDLGFCITPTSNERTP